MRKMFSKKQVEELAKDKIESGDLNINGELQANEVIEKMSGYAFTKGSNTDKYDYNFIYAGIVKNGNKLTLVVFTQMEMKADIGPLSEAIYIGSFAIPSELASKLYPTAQGLFSNALGATEIVIMNSISSASMSSATCIISKGTNSLDIYAYNQASLSNNNTYNVRIEATFLLSENLVA